MLRVMFCAVALAAATPLSAYALTGADLKKLCAATDIASRSACAAYVEGAADAAYNTIEAIGGTTGPLVGQYFCLPEDIKSAQLVESVRRFLEENPQANRYNASTAVALGLGKQYPCTHARN